MRRFKLLPCFIAIFLFFTLGWAHAAIFTVTNLSDSGIGSLRWAIDKANGNSGPDTINFKVSGTIVLLSGLHGINDDGTVIDASSRWLGRYPGGKPGIVLNGSKTINVNGLNISGASYCKIFGLFITGFRGNGVSGIRVGEEANYNYIGGSYPGARNIISGNNIGVDISNSHKNMIIGNYIGTDPSGTLDMRNSNNGILIHEGAQSNSVGGINPQEGNIISGNGTDGILFYNPGTDYNVVLGNYIGTNVDGKAALGNGWHGVRIDEGAKANIIGGRVPGARNIISGNNEDGVNILGSGTDNNLVSGNYIGTDVYGIFAIGNGWNGVRINYGVKSNIIGGSVPGARNIISGNKESGVAIHEPGTENNIVSGNYIGTNANGDTPVGNLLSGVAIWNGAKFNTIGFKPPYLGNVISGNSRWGVEIAGSATGNVVSGNYIGTNAYGNAALGNSGSGVFVHAGASTNIIGGKSSGDRNVISGNDGDGVTFMDKGTNDNIVYGNYIGTDAKGIGNLGNKGNGVIICCGSQFNTIGTGNPDTRNIISGNGGNGVNIDGIGTNNNMVSAAFIGTNAEGTAALGNKGNGISIWGGAQSNVIGGYGEKRNVISGNDGSGVGIESARTNNNIVSGNYIGTDAKGITAIGNIMDGVVISNGAQWSVIGGINPGEKNIISGNKGCGIAIGGSETIKTKVYANYIGTDASGTTALGNKGNGVTIVGGAQSNIIGGPNPSQRNIISGNGAQGINIDGSGTNDNTVSGNYIGTDFKGTVKLGNANGVIIWGGAQSNIIIQGNVISGNNCSGIGIGDPGTNKNIVSGNYIGTDASGTTNLGNTWKGIGIGNGAKLNIIGGKTPDKRNIISGNDEDGVFIIDPGTENNIVSGNYIGTDVKGESKLGNGWNGIRIAGGARSNSISEDRIAFNSEAGIKVIDTDTDYNKISQNSIYDNIGLGIDLENGGNDEIPAPTIASNNLAGSILTVSGNAAGNKATVELFKADSSTSGEGKTYLGSLTADESGNFSGSVDVTGKGLSVGDFLVATTTHTNSNTSEFSQPYLVIGSATITIKIDIKPGEKPNTVNPGANGVIAVAILTTSTAKGESVDFNASTVDPLSIKFGPGEATESHGKGHIEDVDADGDKDMVLHFNMQKTGIKAGDTEACLTGKTIDGKNIKGCDTIVTVPPKYKPELLAPASFRFKALEAYPQPCNPEVWLPYTLGQDVEVKITIHDTSGQLIRTLYLGNQNAGAYVTKDKAVYWDGKNETGEQSTSGIYFYTIKAGNFIATKKLVVLK